ncbi:MAG: homocysteine S-methyltransferase family protein [Cellulosilyticaceae bacterium]
MKIQEVLGKEVLVFDGAMGTMLMAHGMARGTCSAVYTMTHPGLVQRIHEAYLSAGAQLLKTNTFRANRYALAESGYTPTAVITEAVRIARAACHATGCQAYIALDIGMSGKSIGGLDGVSTASLAQCFKEQVEAGIEAGCDLILCETFMSTQELVIAIEAVRTVTDMPLFCTMSFDEKGQTYYGETIQQMIEILNDLPVDAIGVNCSVDPMHLGALVEILLRKARRPVIAMPNAGMPQVEGACLHYPVGAYAFGEQMGEFVRQGVKVVGGCCGTTPEYIHNMVKKIR